MTNPEPEFSEDGVSELWRMADRHVPPTIDAYPDPRAELRAVLRRPSVILSLGVLAALFPIMVPIVGFTLLLIWWLFFG